MILIQSLDNDFSTTEVIKWLLKYRVDFLRINDETYIKSIDYVDNNFKIILDDNTIIKTEDITSYWYRRGDWNFKPLQVDTVHRKIRKEYINHMYYETTSVFHFFMFYLKHKVYCIGDYYSCTQVNKHINIEIARQVGFKVPNYIITSKKEDIICFKKNYDKIITKSHDNTFSLNLAKELYLSYTEFITDDLLEIIPEKFQTSLFQEAIDKKFEIRVFYIKGKCYSMAIFSQNDEQTKVDFRIYNTENPNRNIPFQLPSDIEHKIHLFMVAQKYESGSLDLIYTPKKQYYFLEVNPIGQFGMVSDPCNYMLDKIIAKTLINNNEY